MIGITLLKMNKQNPQIGNPSFIVIGNSAYHAYMKLNWAALYSFEAKQLLAKKVL